jgi:hypothetical protein
MGLGVGILYPPSLCATAYQLAVHTQTTPVAISWRPAATSDLPLLVPKYLVFTATSDQKTPYCILINNIIKFVPLDPIVSSRLARF